VRFEYFPEKGALLFGIKTREVLNTLVTEYIQTGLPVGSDLIARKPHIHVSPATIRNKMAELEDTGFIIRPHISAGGVPSAKGYRYFVETLDDAAEPSPGLKRRVKSSFGEVQPDVEEWMDVASSVLSDLSENMAIVTYPQTTWPRIKHVQIVQIHEFLALLIVVLEQARLRKHVIPLQEPYNQQDLEAITNKFNLAYRGLNRREMLEKAHELTPFEELIKKDTLDILEEDEDQGNIMHSIDGLGRLLSQPEFERSQCAQEMSELLDDNLLLRYIVSKMSKSDKVLVQIGEENTDERLKPFSVVFSQYGMSSGATGVVGVLGPTRMNYVSTICNVRYLSSYMTDLVSSVQ
jgi:heat-inducible transcriptional repressor